ncbi:MAG: hypothetical protein KGH64_01755 [Candidatus Micrarchaeota archaeon]|nr:hypothetical protein [Candidatus Micrarchaeota archaeon]MDE1859132.1 hypothetical protein [Candidatus Micrarchaeota archaeon]
MPTYMYMPALKDLIEKFTDGDLPASRFIHGMVHITGGGLSKLRELISQRRDVDINVSRSHGLNPQDIFWLAHRDLNLSSEQMYTRFNNGIGYVIAVSEEKGAHALEILNAHFDAQAIGRVVEGSGKVEIASKYDSNLLTF